jgi:hypothetical protein
MAHIYQEVFMDAEYRFELTGKTPILFHCDDPDERDRVKAWRDDTSNKPRFKPGDDRTPPWTWQGYLHHDGEHVSLPHDVLMRTLGSAAAKITLSGSTTFKSLSQSGMFLSEEFCRFTTNGKQISMASIRAMADNSFHDQKEKVKKLGFDLFVKPVAVDRKKHLRVRAKFMPWTIDGTIVVVEPAITAAVLAQMFAIAGTRCGLLDWRPNAPKNPGPYGQFTPKLTPLNSTSNSTKKKSA